MAHVMSYQEIKEAAKEGRDIYEEIRVTGIVRPLRFDGIGFIGIKHHCYLTLKECNEEKGPGYNLHYRCWNEEPTEKQMDSTPWEPRVS